MKQKKRFSLLGILPILTVVLSAVFPCVFLVAVNAKEADFLQVVPLMGCFVAAALMMYGAAYMIMPSANHSALAATLMTTVVLNFRIIEKVILLVLPDCYFWKSVPIVLFALAAAIAVIRRFNKDMIEISVSVVSVMFAILIVFNVISALPTWIQKQAERKDESVRVVEFEEDGIEKRRDVYYFIFDEFARGDILKEFYDYDNTWFVEKMENLGFCVSPDSVNGSNSHSTTTITTNYVNLDIVVTDEDSVSKQKEMRQNSEMTALFTAKGYSIGGAGDSSLFGIESSTASSGSGAAVTINGDTIVDLLFKNTILYPLKSDNGVYAETVLNTIEYFENYESDPDQNEFIITYLCLPHQPFIFGANGERVGFSTYYDWKNKSSYLNQLIYTEKIIVEMMGNIIADNPDAVIVIQADHGVRSVSGITDEDKQKILNAVYFGGEPIDEISGKTAIDTLRIVMNKTLDTDYPILGEYEK